MPEYDVEALLDEISDLKDEVESLEGDVTSLEERLEKMTGLVEDAISDGETWLVGAWGDCATALREAMEV